jgi:hypothetical protein
MGASKNQEANLLLRRPEAAGDMRRINARTGMLGGIFDRRRIDCFLTEGSVAFLGWQGSGSRTPDRLARSHASINHRAQQRSMPRPRCTTALHTTRFSAAGCVLSNRFCLNEAIFAEAISADFGLLGAWCRCSAGTLI